MPARNPCNGCGSGPTGRLPDDPLLHACIATYASDMSLFDTMLAPHDVSWDDTDFMGASLDHCMWFHRPFRADEWLLYDMDSPTCLRRPGPGPGIPVHPGR
jgi:acyl-CoA thioesterase-2